MITVEGKFGIKATVLCDSISEAGIRITTYEISYPRIVHSELLTHSMLARNAASSRAIPFAKMQEQLTARPVRFGKNVSGMQDSGDHEAVVKHSRYESFVMTPEIAWEKAKEDAIGWSKAFSDAGYHKQVFNRLTEPFQMIKAVVTGTEWANFFWLRNHEAADPTLHELARCMFEAMEESGPQLLRAGEYHLPYINWLQAFEFDDNDNQIPGEITYYIGDLSEENCEILTIEDAIKVSAARCAAVSFRNEDYTLEKSLQVYDRLVGSDRKHASAFGHQCTPMQNYCYEFSGPNACTTKHINDKEKSHTWEPGVTHADRDGQLWSAMLRGWVQNRKLIPGENYLGEKP